VTPTPSQYHQGTATLKFFSQEDSTGQDQIPCTFKDLQRSRLVVESNTKLNISTVVSVEHEDTLFLGEVVALSSQAEGYAIHISVKQALTGLQRLLTLRSQLAGEASLARTGKNLILESAKSH